MAIFLLLVNERDKFTDGPRNGTLTKPQSNMYSRMGIKTRMIWGEARINIATSNPFSVKRSDLLAYEYLLSNRKIYAVGITNFVTGKPHDPRPTSQCAGQNSPADFIEIRSDSDQALTRLYHVTILSTLATVGTHVTGGQQIGTIDLSGCTSAAHTHIQRKIGGVLVNFTRPCDNSHFDDPSTFYDDSDGTW